MVSSWHRISPHIGWLTAQGFTGGYQAVTSKQLTIYLKERFKNYSPLKLYVRADVRTPGRQIKEVIKIAANAAAIEVIFGVRQE